LRRGRPSSSPDTPDTDTTFTLAYTELAIRLPVRVEHVNVDGLGQHLEGCGQDAESGGGLRFLLHLQANNLFLFHMVGTCSSSSSMLLL
jgi:hypothetical protein